MRHAYTETADEVWYKGNWSRRWPDRKAGPWLLDCRFDMTQRGARLTALTIRPTTTWLRPDLAPRITQRLLRDISVGDLVQEWAAQRQGDLSEEYPVEAELVNKVARRERPSSGARQGGPGDLPEGPRRRPVPDEGGCRGSRHQRQACGRLGGPGAPARLLETRARTWAAGRGLVPAPVPSLDQVPALVVDVAAHHRQGGMPQGLL